MALAIIRILQDLLLANNKVYTRRRMVEERLMERCDVGITDIALRRTEMDDCKKAYRLRSRIRPCGMMAMVVHRPVRLHRMRMERLRCQRAVDITMLAIDRLRGRSTLKLILFRAVFYMKYF